MMKPKVIKSEEDYQEALAHLSTLMDAPPGSPEEEELEVFAILIEKYEEEQFPIDLPDPIEAIKFRMDQQGLTYKDMIPYLGSQSKVSEVLNRKRPLSLAMIRTLNTQLGIPAEVLLQEPGKHLEPVRYEIEASLFAEMYRAGYFASFKGTLREAREMSEELLEPLFAPFKTQPVQRIVCRQSARARMDRSGRPRAGWPTAWPRRRRASARVRPAPAPPG